MVAFLSKCMRKLSLSKIRTSLKAKLIVIFAVLTILPISIVGVVSYTNSFSAVHENTINATTLLADQVNQNIILTFGIAEKFLKIGENEAVIEFLNKEKNSAEYKYENAKKVNVVFKVFKDTFESDKQIKGIYIIGLNGNNISDRQGVYNLSENIKSINTVNTILTEPNRKHIFLNQHIDYSRDNLYANVVSLGTGIIRPVTNELLGVIVVDIDKSAIEDICKDIRIGGNGYFSLISMENEPVCIFSSDPNFNAEKLNKYRDRINMELNGYFTEKTNGQNYFYVFNTLSNTGWKIIGKVRLRDLMQRAYSIRTITIIVVLACIMFTAILYFFISEKLTLPIVNLKDKMKQAEQGNLTVIAECKNKDEIADLCSSFNVMLENIKQLIEKNKKEQEELKKSELKLMQAQINPHFLYNTLDTIVWLSEAKESASVIEITKALSGFFRATLSSGRDWITLDEEIDHTLNYLIIQKMRYMDILDYRIDIVDENVLNCRILKLMLQPVVENALYHGVKNKNSYGLIIIKVSKTSEENILLEVIDNGQGMTEKRLKEVIETINNESLNETKDRSFGLRNVNQRIKLYYGMQYGLDIKSKYTEGTHVSMIIPEVR